MPEQSDELTVLLRSEVYAAAFEAVMRGSDVGLLPDEQRVALRRAQELTGVSGPGYPMPAHIDPTRSHGV